jgi:AGCS family alanine or glycine:cation symporter
MLSAFISANVVCFSFALMIVASGVWNNGLTSTALTSSAYETVFGSLGGWIVVFLSISFGMGTVVSYAYIGRACWVYLTGGRFMPIFTALFCAVTFLGALAQVEAVWNATDLVNAGLLVSNLFGILYLLPRIKQGLNEYKAKHG